MLLSSFWKPFYPRGRSFLWKVSDADIAHVKLQESPPGALMCSPLRVLRWCQRGGILLSSLRGTCFLLSHDSQLRQTLPHVTEYTQRQWSARWAHTKPAQTHTYSRYIKQTGRGWDTCIAAPPFQGNLEGRVHSGRADCQILLFFSWAGVMTTTHSHDLFC